MSRKTTSVQILAVVILVVVAGHTGDHGRSFLPNGVLFPNSAGTSTLYSTSGVIDLTGPFFQPLGTNGRTCATCHQPGDGMSISAEHIEERFNASGGLDPIFRTNDGSNCNHDLDVSSVTGRRNAYSLLRTRGLIRVAIGIPNGADFNVLSVDNPYGCNERDVISQYRRPLPAANLRFLSSVMWDGREATSLTGTTQFTPSNFPGSLDSDLRHQSFDATSGHEQGDGNRPTPAEQQQIVDFETSLYTAQATGKQTGVLNALGAKGGLEGLISQEFFVGINSQIAAFENPLSGLFTPTIFTLFDSWSRLPAHDPRAAVARGQALFNSKPINITGVAGLNDDVSAGGLVPGGIATIAGTCGTCHDTPNVGNHSFPKPLDIGTGDPSPNNPSVNLGGLDITFLPRITVQNKSTLEQKTTTDLGQALIDGRFDHVGKIKGPILRGLASRAPYFHNGSAETLLDVIHFYEVRFGVPFTPQEESDLVAFLNSL